MNKFNEFTQAYLIASLWSSTDETNPEQGGEPLDDNYEIEDIESDTLSEMVDDCTRFQEENAELLNEENHSTTDHHYTCEARAGHDFWLTRNGHGCGFWDGDWNEPAASKLTDAATAFGEYYITASGDGGQVSKM